MTALPRNASPRPEQRSTKKYENFLEDFFPVFYILVTWIARREATSQTKNPGIAGTKRRPKALAILLPYACSLTLFLLIDSSNCSRDETSGDLADYDLSPSTFHSSRLSRGKRKQKFSLVFPSYRPSTHHDPPFNKRNISRDLPDHNFLKKLRL